MSYETSAERSLWKGIVAGAVGGFIASYAMNQFQAGLSRLSQAVTGEGGDSEGGGGGEDATVKTAEAISQNVLDEPLPEEQKQAAGSAVHYAFGTSMGALYGGCAAVLPAVTAGSGMLWGTAVFVVADEISVPALGLSKPPTETPASSHAKAYASHCVYGLVTELVRRTLLKMG